MLLLFLLGYRRFSHLQHTDTELTSTLRHILTNVVDVGVTTTNKQLLSNIHLTGSAREGSIVTQLLQTTELACTLECDIAYNIITIPFTHAYYIEDVIGQPGVVRCSCDGNMMQFVNNIGWRAEDQPYILDEISEHDYVTTRRLKQGVWKQLKITEDEKKLELVLAAAFDTSPCELRKRSKSVADREAHGSVWDCMEVNLDGGGGGDEEARKLNISSDLAFEFQLEWWPSIAREFIEREREWPDGEVMALLTSRCYVTSRPYGTETTTNDVRDFRYSFEHVERDLITLRSDHQNLVYLIFKSMFHKWIAPIHPDKLRSFLSKTVMFWTCEKYSSEHPLWNPSSTRTLLVLNHLFNELLNAFKKSYLPNFFLPEINVIPDMNRQYARKVMHKIKSILDDLISYIPDDVTDVIATSEEVLRVMTSAEVTSYKLKEKDYTVLCNRAELIPKLFKLFMEGCTKE